MTSILAATARDIDYTVDITFPDASYFKFATSPLVIPVKGTYTNDLESVNEIRRSLESVTDKVGFSMQNKDTVLGQHVANNLAKWQKAFAVVGRYYRDADGLGLSEWIEMFRGVVQQPKSDDLHLTLDVLADTLAPGEIVCNRTLAAPCPFVFKDAKTCAYSGGLTTCDHNLKSSNGCDGRTNSQHFGGMEHRFQPDASIPGTGGNTGGGTGGGIPPCPRLDQYVRVLGESGLAVAKQVRFFTVEDRLWNPKTRRFHKTRLAKVVRNEPIWEMVAANGATSYSSHSHRRLWYFEHGNGEPVCKFIVGDPVLTVIGDELLDSKAIISRDTGEIGDVMFIEMDPEGHGDDVGRIYCTGDSPDKMFTDHNNKPLIDE
jgi:hypothetical protein